MKYTDVAWDFDGTLMDSYPNCVRAFREMLQSFGCDEPEEALYREMVVTIRHALTVFSQKHGLEPEEMMERYKRLEGFHPEIVLPYPGIADVLKQIRDSGRRNHLYTNRNHDAVRYLEEHGLLQYFDGLYTRETFEKMKPDPEGMYRLLREYQVTPGQVLMVGDRELDLLAAKAAGADGCFWNTNGIAVPECADYVPEKIEDLLGYL